MPACEPVSEIAWWPMSQIAIAQSAQEMRSPVDSSMSISRGEGRSEISFAWRIRSSVVLPRAESTTTTDLPASRAATIRRAARLMSSGPATDVPPNFMTTTSRVAIVSLASMERIRIETRRGRQPPRGRANGARTGALCFDRGALDRSVYLRRRLAAVAIAVGATVLIWLLLFSGGGEDSASGAPEVTIAQLQPETQARLAGLDDAGKVDQLILATDPGVDDGEVGGALVSTDLWESSGGSKDLIDGFHSTVVPTRAIGDRGDPERPQDPGDGRDDAGGRHLPRAARPAARAARDRDRRHRRPQGRRAVGRGHGQGAAQGRLRLQHRPARRHRHARQRDRRPRLLRRPGDRRRDGRRRLRRLRRRGASPAFPPTSPARARRPRTPAPAQPASRSMPAHSPPATCRRSSPPSPPAPPPSSSPTRSSRPTTRSRRPRSPPRSSTACCAPNSASRASRSPAICSRARSAPATRSTRPPSTRSSPAPTWSSSPIAESIESVRAALLAAVESGEISTDRLNSAAGRVIEMKQALGLLD